ncbi:hypothetical protein PVAND_002587 [Polypedilum vanderplanki]|uniref:Uncharacterized protein n=1 Tax=Polypedilum vanderplanki TaxID=319348 RepID=A0A9J6BRF7_POLVA|nr:hypothetical protein PVAND_002587 [Polypedilum vanderplanki]
MEEYKEKIESWIVKIQNQERMIRQRALKEFLEFCQNESNLTSDNAIEVFDSSYLCLIKCYSDRFEMCRSLACSIITEILKHLQQNDYYLSLLVPVIGKRLASLEIVEESEEMRLQLLKQLNFIINKYKDLNSTGTVKTIKEGEDRLLKPYNEIIDILKVRLMDTYPAILNECCEIIKITAIASPSFHYRAEVLVTPLTTLLKHRHSNIRIVAIEALGIVALNIYTNLDVVRKIVKDISPLLMDPVPFVRRECGRVGCMFLKKLRDRYSLFEQIIPLVLCCLTDEIQEVRDEIENLWIEAGDLYYEENQVELQPLVLVDTIPDNYPELITNRPTLGCRALVRKSLRVLNAVLHEMEDWKEDVRLHATKLLMQIVIHSEEHLTTKYYDINAVLCKTCQDQEIQIAKLALQVANIIGYFVNQKTWSKYAFEELRTRQNKLGIIKCIDALYENSKDKERFDNLYELTEILLDTSICHSDSDKLQMELFQLLRNLIPGVSIDNDNLVKNFYVIALKTTSMAMAYDNKALRNEGINILKLIDTKCNNRDNLSLMHSKYLKATLGTLDLLDKANNEQVMILYGIICICGFEKPFIDVLKQAIKTALEHCEAEGKIKILSAIAIASLNWDKTIGFLDDSNEKFLILKCFIDDCIVNHLIWQAGRTAESVRTMATAALCSLVQGTSKENAMKIVESLMVPLVSLIDDNNIGTRAYALKTFMNSGPLKYDQLKIVASVLWSRLNDPGNEVRVLAAKCLGQLKLMESEQEEFDDMCNDLLKQVLKTMLIHLESPEIDLRNALIESISDLAKTHSSAYKDALNDSTISQDLKSKLPAPL